jgi:hypothetical protein
MTAKETIHKTYTIGPVIMTRVAQEHVD